MIRPTKITGASLILALLLGLTPANAEPTQYSYSGSAFPNPVGTVDNVPVDRSQGQGLQFFRAQNTFFATPNSVGSGELLSMSLFNHDPHHSIITFHDVHFSVAMDLRQTNPSAQATETYHGILRGTVDYATHSSSLVADVVDSRPRNISFGATRYYFVVEYSNPILWNPTADFPGASTPGNFTGAINAAAYLGPAPSPAAVTPEPSCLALVGIGLACTVGAAIRRKLRVVTSI